MMIRKIRHSQSRPFGGLVKAPIKNNPGDMKWILLGTGNPFSGYSREKPANTQQIIGKMKESLEMDLKDRKTFDEDCNKII